MWVKVKVDVNLIVEVRIVFKVGVIAVCTIPDTHYIAIVLNCGKTLGLGGYRLMLELGYGLGKCLGLGCGLLG